MRGFIQWFAEPGEEIHLHYESARHVAEAAVEYALARFQRTGSARRWDGTFFTACPTQLTGSLAQAAERINEELQEKVCQMCQSEAVIDYACDHDRVL